MKSSSFLTVFLATALACGCASHRSSSHAVKPVAVKTAPVITPDASLSAKVVSYNQAGGFVVLGFSSERLPAIGQTLFLYRNGLKTAELKVTGPRSENNIVADIVAGDAQLGDEVRDQ